MVMVNVDKLERGATAEAARVTSRAFLRNPLHVAAFKGDSEALRRRQEAMYKTIFDHFPGELLAARWGTPLVGVLGMTLWPDCEVGAIRGLMVLPRLLLALRELTPRLAAYSSLSLLVHRCQAAASGPALTRLCSRRKRWCPVAPVGHPSDLQSMWSGDRCHCAVMARLRDPGGAGE